MSFKNFTTKTLFLSAFLFLMSTTSYSATIKKVTVNGMKCACCVQKVVKKIEALKEVSRAKVELKSKLLKILVEKDQVLTDKVINQKVKEAGFKVVSIVTINK